MCGISGVISRRALDEERIATVRRVNAALFHRGPDGAGELLAGGPTNASAPHIFLAMRRLSIIDLAHGWQPLFNEDRSVALIANGEIYNHVELRQKLLGAGHTFLTHSDCEVIVHLYEEYGADCVQHLRGMFAFALWDSRKRRVIIARDRMGEKPLYLRFDTEQVMFASELGALAASGDGDFGLDPASVDLYLRYGWVPEPRTILKNIVKLAPASMLQIDLDPWQVTERTYWSLAEAPPVEGNPASSIRDELEKTMSLIVRADVPVGIALSGGLDSSIIAAMAARSYGDSLQAFTVGYRDAVAHDERGQAKTLADSLKIRFHEIEVDTQDMLADFETVVRMRDDPIADISGHGYYVVSRKAREMRCPVLLQGQGGDEIFWGYPWTVDACIASSLKMSGAGAARFGMNALMGARPLSKSGLTKAARFAVGAAMGWRTLEFAQQKPQDLVLYDINENYERGRHASRNVLSPEFRQLAGYKDGHGDIFASNDIAHPADIRVIAALCRSYLLQNGIAQGDRLSMANSVELRLPFVDYRLAEVVVGLHKTHSTPLARPKAWLIEAIKDLLPPEIINRPKRGFTPPVRAWMNALRLRHGATLLDGYLVQSGALRGDAAQFVQHERSWLGPWNETGFRLLVLETWCRHFSSVHSAARKNSLLHSSMPDALSLGSGSTYAGGA